MNTAPDDACRILVVEDDRDTGIMLVDLLSEEGYALTLAPDGAAAVRVLETVVVPPDLIVLDLVMPIMDGPTFARHLQSCPRWHAIPIIVLSAWSEALAIAEALPMSDCLPKPFHIPDLLTRVAFHCSQPVVP